MGIKKMMDSLKAKNQTSKKRKKDVFDLSLRDVGRASRRLIKRVIVHSIRSW